MTNLKNIEDICPLSPLQQGMLFHTIYAPESGVYFEQLSCTLKGNLEVQAFQLAWQQVVARHQVLRTAFIWKGQSQPLQVVYRQVQLPLEIHDWQGVSHDQQQQQLSAFLGSDRERGFQLSQAPLMRLTLIQIAQNVHQFVWSHHHLLMDGWSVHLVLKEVLDFYETYTQGQDLHLEPTATYRDYIAWLQKQDKALAEGFWRQVLQGFRAPTSLTVDRARAPTSQSGARAQQGGQQIQLSAEAGAALVSFVRQHQLTLNTMVQGAWALLLSRYSGEADVVFGVTVSGRPPAIRGVESIVGLLINTLPIRVSVRADESPISWLKQIQYQQVEMSQYEYSPLVQVQGWSEVPRGVPLFESIVVFENYSVDAALRQPNFNLQIGDVRAFEKTNYPLTLIAVPGDQLSLRLSYDSRRFDDATITRMLRHFQTLLEGIVANPEQPLWNLPLLTAAEHHQLLVEWNDTQADYPKDACIHQLFEAQVEQTPDAIAVVFGEEQLSYQKLNTRSNQLANHLQKLGVGPEVLVGICVERSVEMVVGLLGILKAGGAYVPLDPAYPQERLAFMLADAQVLVLVTHQHLVGGLPEHDAQVLCLDTNWYMRAQERADIPLTQVRADNLAYVIYTSGSTGRPKGVAIEHCSTVTLLDWARATFAPEQLAGVLASTSICFDLSVFELFVPLSWGGKIILAENALHLPTLPAAEDVTLLNTVPSAIAELLRIEGLPTSVRTINLAGEPLHNRLVQQLYQQDTIQEVFNLYGPSEDTTYSTFALVNREASKSPTIGRPIANTQIYILDSHLQPVPVGIPGELHIGGAGLARGYLNRPELTAEKFIFNPFTHKAGARIYKTGDQARYLPDGNIELLGRIDHQVKVRGFRIELGEIEAVLTQHPQVRQTVVVVQENKSGNKSLVAYVVPQQESASLSDELQSFLREKLPAYMVPAAFVKLDALPLTPNGKVDRQALPAPDLARTESDEAFVAPRTPIEEVLAGIWTQTLGTSSVGIHNNFFELGGHSLLATQVISQVRKAFQIELPLRYLFESPTVAGLAEHLERAMRAGQGLEALPIERVSHEEAKLPLSFAQARLWFLNQLQSDSGAYNIPAAVRLTGKLNITALAQSFNEIVCRHAVLRATFASAGGQPTQQVAPSPSLAFPVVDLQHLPETESKVEVERLATQEAQQPFDLATGPLVRVTLLQLASSEHVVLLTMHHIVSDGWSMGVFIWELGTLYKAFSTGKPSPLPELPIQYADFAVWQRQWLQGEVLEAQLAYWREHLEEAVPVLQLPTDRRRPSVQKFLGATQSFSLSHDLTERLKTLSRQEGVTLFMTLLAGFKTLLHRYSFEDDIVVGSSIANRNRSEIEGLIGFFVNTLVLRTDLSGNPSFRQLLERVREVALGAYGHQDLPFEYLVEVLQPERSLSYNPLFQVLFVLQNAPMEELRLPELTLISVERESWTAKFDLTLSMVDTKSGLVGSLEYNTDLFNASTITRMLGHLNTLFEGIVTNPEQHLLQLPLLTTAERQQLLVEWNNTQADYPNGQCIHQLFEAQVDRAPDAIAVVFEGSMLTYWELNARANRIAHHLQTLGVAPEVLVGICVERSLDMVVGLLAILKAGGAYVPLDLTYPQERLAFILEDSQVAVLLSMEHLVESLPKNQARVVCIDAEWETIDPHSSDNPASQVTPDNLAYVIYTSGSTGKPKGVAIEHHSTVALLDWAREIFAPEYLAGVLASTSICFDLSVFELFVPLCWGGKVILADNALSLPTLPFAREVTLINTVPSAITELLRVDGLPASVRVVNLAGEPLHNSLVQQMYQKETIEQVFNLYGPSEDTTYSTFASLSKGYSIVTIGRPISNTRCLLLDAHKQPVPIGVPGELYISGAGLARGYLNRPELTALRFIANPWSDQPGERLYKTGDLARYLADGNIEFLGRIDRQVKIRGFRIELGEIEAVLAQHPQVQETVVVVREDIPGNKRLVAYLVANQQQPTTSQLRSFLQIRLPNYMVPGAFMVLNALPLTPNGKIDRRALPAPDQARPELEVAHEAPRTDLERTILKVWQEALHLEEIGIHDNFFDLGGHSLLLAEVHSKLLKMLKLDFPMVVMFQYPTISSLAEHLGHEPSEQPDSQLSYDRLGNRITSTKRQKQTLKENRADEIAIIGMAGRFPGAKNLEQFWQNLQEGVELISFFTDEELASSGIDSATINHPNYVNASAVLQDIDLFDATFFGFSPREAEITDPQHRLFLECAWEALESAGYDSTTYQGRIGIYAGAGLSTYALFNLYPNLESLESMSGLQALIRNDKDFLSTCVSYKLNLRGPSLNIQTACSTSLVAVHVACQSLLNDESDIALAGGVRVTSRQKAGYLYQEEGILSPDGHCRAFDAKAQGTVGGNGAGIVVLKRLDDALADGDCIHAVIKGSAINNDGSLKVGYTAPSVDGQAQVIAQALAVAGISPEMVSYVEAHGTGTSLGDPIEMAALNQVFRNCSHKRRLCAIGSLKTNIGHLDTAAGVAGLIKTVLALKHKLIPPSLHFESPNPQIDFDNSPFYVNNTLSEWKANGNPRCAGVSSFGIGGTNAHAIVEEAPTVGASGPSRPNTLLVLSAKTGSALQMATQNIVEHLKQNLEINLADVAYTLQVGRCAFDYRRVIVCQNLNDAIESLSLLEPQRVLSSLQKPCNRPIVFMFPGQGAQYVNMGKELYQVEPVFRELVERCCLLLEPHLGLNLRHILYPTEEQTETAGQQLQQTCIAQPALFVIEYALAQLWMGWGVRPQAMIGHSIGEYVAATLAGVLSLEDALALVATRGQLMQQLPAGAMLAVPLGEKQVQSLLGESKQLSLAASDGPSLCIVSGPRSAIDDLQNQLTLTGVDCRCLHTSHTFHSSMIDPIVEPFLAQVRKVNLKAPQIAFVSNVTGTWITKAEATDPSYWARHLRQTVRFAEGVAELIKEPKRVLLEVGPGRTLSTLVGKQKVAEQVILSSLRHPQDQQSDTAFLLNTLSRLWLNGVQVDWSEFYAHEKRHRLPLPTYPFERKRYWIESSKANDCNPSPKKEISVSEPENVITISSEHNNILSILKGILSNFLGVSSSEIDIHTHFLEMGVDSLIFSQISRAIQEQLGIRISFRLLLEELPTIDALAIHIAQELPPEELTVDPAPHESKPAITPEVPTEQAFFVKPSETQALNQEDEKPVAGTAMEQLMAQQLQLMSKQQDLQFQIISKQLDLLREGGSSRKILPSSEAIQSSPLHNNIQVAQTSTNTSVSQESQSTDFPLVSTKAESEQQPRSWEMTPRQFVPSQRIEKESMAGLTPRQQKHLDALIARIVKRTQESKRLTQAYRSYHANSRAISGFLPYTKEMVYPIHAQRGEGARLWDVDGNEYVDISMGFGSLLFGHSPSFVIEALQENIQNGIQHGPQSRLAGQVAELLCEMTGAERAAFCTTGTEAIMGAIRLARAATGRSKIALFAGSYHGTFDGVLVRGVATDDGTLRSLPGTLGVPSYMAEDVMVLDYGTPKSLNTLKAHAHELAAILVEPVQSSRPDWQPKDFLHELRALTEKTGTVLIFDEVITGFRMHPGGIQALWDIQADITTYGKAVGAGLPIGVVAGKAAFMDAIDGGFWSYGDASYPQAETTTFSGTFFKHPLVMSAAWATLNHMKNSGSKLQEELTQRTTKLADTLNSYFEQKQVSIRVVNFGSLFQLTSQNNFKFSNLLLYHMLEKGVYVWEGRTRFLSTAHTDEDIERVIRAVKESVIEMQEGEFFPPSPISINGRDPMTKRTVGLSNNLTGSSSNLGTESSSGTSSGCSEGDTEGVLTVPLLEAQKELWFLANMGDEASRAYNESRTIHLRGPFNLAAARKAVQEIVNRHEALRTTFSPEGDYQRITSTLTLDIPFNDLSSLDNSKREAQLSEFLAREAQQTFDLEQDPLLRAHIVKLEEQHHLLVLTSHHIVADGWSMGILLRELSAIYSAECQGLTCQLPQPMKLSEYAQWQAHLQQSPEMAKAKAYWLEQFTGSVPVLELPTDRPRPTIFTYAGAQENMTLGTSLYSALKSLSAQRGCTLFTTLLAGFMTLLQRLTGQKDIVVGIAAAGQSSVEDKYLVGHCVNLLPIRNQVVGDAAFAQYLSSVKQVLLEAYDHQVYPFIKLIESLNLPRDLSRAPLITTIFNLDKAGSELESVAQKVELVKNPTNSAKYDMAFNIVQTASDLLVECDYNTDLFNSQTIQRWMRHFQTLLSGIVANPDQRLSDLPLLTEAEQHQLLVEWNDTQTDYSQDKCIHQLFEAQVEQTPDAVAVVFGEEQLSYQELDTRANHLANHLQKLGVAPEVLVGICVERSVEMVVGLLGILKAGGAYVPLDPAYPQERLAFMLADASVQVLVTQQQLVGGLPNHDAQVVCLDTNRDANDKVVALRFAQENASPPLTQIRADHLAYVIYTSGSTGKPKGVLVSHSNVVRLLAATQSWFDFAQDDVWSLFHSYAFDFSVWELWGALVHGGRLVVVPYWVSRTPETFYELLCQEQVTVLNQTPSAFRQLIWVEQALESAGKLKHLRLVIFGGEALELQSLKPWFECYGDQSPQLVNMYGITETTVHVTHRPLTISDLWMTASVIGRPIPDLQVYLLDQHLHPVPVGVPGEMYIGGAGVVRGYLNRPGLTAERFIANPFNDKPEARLYKTGDLARYLPNGDIEYLGRIDHQVKIRGFRIELSEIEAVLSQHPSVRETVILVREDEPGNKRLVAYTVSQPKQAVTINELRRFLEDKLPNYMVPSAFVMLEALPLTPNGKVDRLALPAPEALRPELEVAYVMPQTEVERAIATVWQKALHVEKIGIHDNFFELGGHSLLMVKVYSQLREIFTADLSIIEMFRYPTISSIAKYFNEAKNQILFLEDNDIQTHKIDAGKAQKRKRLQKMKLIENI